MLLFKIVEDKAKCIRYLQSYSRNKDSHNVVNGRSISTGLETVTRFAMAGKYIGGLEQKEGQLLFSKKIKGLIIASK